MKNIIPQTEEELMGAISTMGVEAVHVMTMLAAYVARFNDREGDADLISTSAREIANIVLSLHEQYSMEPERFHC